MKPILYNTEMVRAILEDRKTVTRRVVKPQPKKEVDKIALERFHKPYSPGDILYVRETWATVDRYSHNFGDWWSEYIYRASYSPDPVLDVPTITWRPSIHMPREAARIFLRVTDVRVERLQDITELDILEKEGVTVDFPQPKPSYMSLAYTETRLKPAVRKAFADLWDSTIKKADRALYGWEANPWVFVISFERILKDEALQQMP